MAVIDHLVVAAASLDEGTDYLQELLGVALAPGGRHTAMGTHNRLLKLGPALYLELIAIDPEATPPGRARWFGLDDRALQASLAERPRLIHWVARTDDIASARTACPEPLGEVLELTRGDYRWRLTVTDSGRPPGDGLVPSLIQWETPLHPADRLPEMGCALMKLEGFHPEPIRIRRALESLGLAGAMAVFPCEPDEAPFLAAHIRTPAGLRELS